MNTKSTSAPSMRNRSARLTLKVSAPPTPSNPAWLTVR